MSAAELAKGYTAYTDASELGTAVVTEGRAAAQPTTTILTTTLNCFETEA